MCIGISCMLDEKHARDDGDDDDYDDNDDGDGVREGPHLRCRRQLKKGISYTHKA